MMPPATVDLDPVLRRAAQSVADELADTLAVPPSPETNGDRGPTSPRWRGQSLSKGAAGIALVHGVRAHAGLGTWKPVHAWLACANREELSAGPGAGLWYGATALGFALSFAAPSGAYHTARRRLDDAVAALTRARLEAAANRIADRRRPSRGEFDLVRGLTGLGVYWLRRDPDRALLRQVLTYLVRLCESLPADDPAGPSVPGWWSAEVPFGNDPRVFAGGWSDQGMAHGITGPLAFMALCLRQQISVPGQADAMERIGDWLDAWRQEGPAGPWWPERITLAEHYDGCSRQGGPARPSWCYGLVGVLRALQLSGVALGNTVRQQAAEQALARCLADPDQLARLGNPALCHGLAGVLATYWYAAADAQPSARASHLTHLLQTLLDDYATGAHQPAWQRPGLIEGTAGVVLTLHTITTSTTSSGWPTCLLIN